MISIGVRLFLIISHFISFYYRVVFLLGCGLLWLIIQQAGCIKIDSLQIIIDRIDALSTPH